MKDISNITLEETNLCKQTIARLFCRYDIEKLGDFKDITMESLLSSTYIDVTEIIVVLKKYGIKLKDYNVDFVEKRLKIYKTPEICDVEILNELPLKYFRKNSASLKRIKNGFGRYYRTLLKINMLEKEKGLNGNNLTDDIFEEEEFEVRQELKLYSRIMSEKMRLLEDQIEQDQLSEDSVKLDFQEELKAKKMSTVKKMRTELDEEQKRYHHKSYEDLQF